MGNSAYAFWPTTDIYISRKISIEHPSVGLALLAQLDNPYLSTHIYVPTLSIHTSTFKINAKIEDVGLTEHEKKYGNKKWSLNFHDKQTKKIKILHTAFQYCKDQDQAILHVIQFLTGYLTLQKSSLAFQ